MELILAIILGAILLIRIGHDKVGDWNYELWKKQYEEKVDDFEAMVGYSDDLFWDIRRSMWSQESLEYAESVLHSFDGCENASIPIPTNGKEDSAAVEFMETVLLAKEGKVFGSFFSINLFLPGCSFDHPRELVKAKDQYARWLVSQLREHGIDTRIIKYRDASKICGYAYAWEPCYNWENDPKITQEIIE